MVMKRSSDIDSPRRNKRTRSGLDVLNTVNSDRYSSSESDRRGRAPSPDNRSYNRKSERRTYSQAIKNDFDDEHFKGKRTERDEEASVRVTNLTKSAADHVLREKLGYEFKKFGEISIRIVKHGDERYAVVYFRNSEDAREAKRSIENRGRVLLYDRALNLEFNFPGGRSRRYTPDIQQDEGRYSRGSTLGSKIHRDRRGDDFDYSDLDENKYERKTREGGRFYSQSPPPIDSVEEDDPKATRTLFVGNLETSISRQDVRHEFERFGMVEDVDIKRPLRSQGSTYAFVKFIDLDVATKAKQYMQGHFIGRNRVKIGYGKSMPTTRLWVGGLGSWTSLVEVEREFDRFGAIRRIDYKEGDNHAFILYDSLDAASVAAREMRGFQLNGRRLKIDFADLKQGISEYSHSSDAVENRYSGEHPEDQYRDEELFQKSPEKKRLGRERDDSDTSRRWSDSVNNHNFKDSKIYSQQGVKHDNWQRRAEKEIKRDKWEEKQTSVERFKFRGPRTPSPDLRSLEDHKLLTSSRRSHERTKSRESHKLADGNSRKRSPPAKRPRKSPPPDLSSQFRNPNTPLQRPQSISPTSDRNHKSNIEKKNKEKDREKLKNKDREKTKEKTKENSNIEKEKPKPVKEENTHIETSASGGGSESLQDIAKRFAVAWRGSLILKNSSFPVRLHLIGGNPEIVEVLLRNISGNSSPNTVLRISQRLRLDQPKLEEVSKRMNTAGASGYCMLLALPGIQGSDPPVDTETSLPTQQRPLRNLVTYLKQKQAAGVVNLLNPSPQSPTSIKDDSGVLHAFPPCQYSHDQLLKIAPHLGQDAFREDHLVVVVIRGAA